MAYSMRTRAPPQQHVQHRPQAPAQNQAGYPQYGTPQRVPQGVPTQQVMYARAQPQAAVPAPSRPQTVFHPECYPPGPLGFFLPPPGQRSLLDPTLRTPPKTQAFYTTYPARLRTGVTSLIQPENVTGGPREREAFFAEMEREKEAARTATASGASTPRVNSPAPTSTPAATTASRLNRSTTLTMSGRRAGRVNYAEAEESDDEDEEESESEVEEAPSDPDDDNYGGDKRKRGRIPDMYVDSSRLSKMRRRQAELEQGWTWLGDRTPAERVRSVYARQVRPKIISEDLLEEEADRPELLVPVVIDLDIAAPNTETPGYKVRDRFLWNANEPFYKPNEFAQIFCEDVGISVESYAPVIADLIKSQVEEAQSTVAIDLATEEATPDDVLWSDDEVEDVTEVDEDGEAQFVEPDCRIVINLDVQIFTHVLRDRIEWDLSSTLTPVDFAKHYCAELGLTGEAVPLIAHALHEELIKHKRDALELDLFARTHPLEQAKWEKSGPSGQPRTTNKHGAKGLVGVWRDWMERDEFAPMLIELSTEEIEKREGERGRESRRIMRTLNTKRRR